MIILDTRDIADPAITERVCQIEKLGTDRYELYVQNAWWKRQRMLTSQLKETNLPLFCCPPVKEHSKSQQWLSSLKNDCSLFSRLFVASQIRDGVYEKVFWEGKPGLFTINIR